MRQYQRIDTLVVGHYLVGTPLGRWCFLKFELRRRGGCPAIGHHIGRYDHLVGGTLAESIEIGLKIDGIRTAAATLIYYLVSASIRRKADIVEPVRRKIHAWRIGILEAGAKIIIGYARCIDIICWMAAEKQ